jgi:hypothetical protein
MCHTNNKGIDTIFKVSGGGGGFVISARKARRNLLSYCVHVQNLKNVIKLANSSYRISIFVHF